MMKTVLDQHFISMIVSGGARGADSLAEKYANENKINTDICLPDYNKYGRKAPFIRNKQIVNGSDVIIAFWDGKSKGTKHSIDYAKSKGKKVIVFLF